MSAYTLWFDSVESTLPEIGGKGINLNRLIRGGFPVPPGFFVTIAAYQAFVEENHLQTPILAVVNDQTKSVEERSITIRTMFDHAVTPIVVVTAIQEAYRQLLADNTVPVAVRSSATAEDLLGASFAGQQESYLNVCGEAALLIAVKRCWSSLWTARAIEYRQRQAIAPASVSLAVVVQVMIPAESSGIMFTANPMTGTSDEIILNAAWGLGEAIVGGLVTPDHFIVDKATGQVKHITVANKAVMTVPTAMGTDEQAVEAIRQTQQVLDVAQVEELSQLGLAIEAHYGQPQDIEWCYADRHFFILQSRPITTLAASPIRWDSPLPGAKWVKDVQVTEWISEPPSPLGMTTTLVTMINAREQAHTWPPVPKQFPPWYALINGWLYIRADLRVTTLLGFLAGLGWCMLTRTPNGNDRVVHTWSIRLPILGTLERVDYHKMTNDELKTHLDRLLHELGWWWMEFVWFAAIVRTGIQVLTQMRIPTIPDPGVFFRGYESLLLESERVLRQAANDSTKIERYLARFGHIVESADPIQPMLRESPGHLAWQLAAARQSERDLDQQLTKNREERAKATEALSSVKAGLRTHVVRNIVAIGQSHAPYADNAAFHFQRVLAMLRATFLEVGTRLFAVGKLSNVDDVFYLKRDELWSARFETADNLATVVKERRTAREQAKRLAAPLVIPPIADPAWKQDAFARMLPPAMRAAMFERGMRKQGGKHVLVGSAGSPGRARGIARIISTPADSARFQKGDVLVTHTTSPIWTPLFGIASAVVTETGGQFAHAAIVAREFGIPLVDGAPDATHLIVDGSPIVVDGSAGIVEF